MSSSVAVLKTEARLFGREPGSIFWIVAFPTLLIAVLGLVPSFREADLAIDGRRMIDLYVPAAVLLAVMMAGTQAMPTVLTGYREHGILRRMSTTPVRPASLLTAQIVLHGAVAVGAAILAIVVSRLAYGVPLPGHLLGYATALVLATLAALALGATISALAPTTKACTTLSTVVFFPLMISAGVWGPIQVMPDLLQRILHLTPFGAAVQALNQAMGGDWPSWQHLGVTVVWAVALIAAAARWFRWE